ncbi:MAG: 2-aminoethylphosphonate--pyruvate transaminase [Spirochaetales bacterium]|nr:2-aminoethylphosphonate--pyruvate transaminase [Spirochaetales bacterium]
MSNLINEIPEEPYLLLTPGPLSTSKTVRASMLRDWCTWDEDYNNIVQEIRKQLLEFSAQNYENYTSVLLQGSGTYSIEATLGSIVPNEGKVLVAINGAYGKRIVTILNRLGIKNTALYFSENKITDPETIKKTLEADTEITHVAVVHCETTTGILNPIEKIASIVKESGRIFFVDMMSSFGGIPVDLAELDIDVIVSSANKCIQGVPGFGFTIIKKNLLESCEGIARSYSLDLYDQWKTMEDHNGKWRFTSPTHTVRAFHQALMELKEEGGINARFKRYSNNRDTLINEMYVAGFPAYIEQEHRSPFITTFLSPESEKFNFNKFYQVLKNSGFVIYPGKLTDIETFRIGNIGEVFPEDMKRLGKTVRDNKFW